MWTTVLNLMVRFIPKVLLPGGSHKYTFRNRTAIKKKLFKMRMTKRASNFLLFNKFRKIHATANQAQRADLLEAEVVNTKSVVVTNDCFFHGEHGSVPSFC